MLVLNPIFIPIITWYYKRPLCEQNYYALGTKCYGNKQIRTNVGSLREAYIKAHTRTHTHSSENGTEHSTAGVPVSDFRFRMQFFNLLNALSGKHNPNTRTFTYIYFKACRGIKAIKNVFSEKHELFLYCRINKIWYRKNKNNNIHI